MSEHQSEPTTILEIKTQHSGSAPTIEINCGDYAGYFQNDYREQLIFVCRKGEDYAMLYHSDYGWKPVRLHPNGGPEVDVVLTGLEHAWLRICWRAARP
jgi:hypothetical protein